MTTTLNASNSGSGGLVATADASGILALQTAGTTAVTVDASQNVGIGTSSPAAKLHVGALNGTGSLNGYTKMVVEATDYSVVTLKCPAANTNQIIFTDTTSAGLGFINYYNSSNATPNAMAFQTASTERMRITSAGVVQVGNNAGTGEVFAQNSLKFWVCMQASTGTAYNSFGLSSTSKISTGTFQLNYTRTMASSRYGCAGAAYGAGVTVAFGAESTTGIRMYVFTSSSGSLVDNDAMGNMGGGS